MPTWGELIDEQAKDAGADDDARGAWLDAKRKESLALLRKLTGRPTVLYSSRWMQEDTNPTQVMISIQDLHAFMEVLHGLQGKSLDLILHSPGGDPNAAEAIIGYVRSRFDDVRVIVPVAAMSAATMMACGADVIIMGKHSHLGPIDPQFVLQTPLGRKVVAAHAILEQYRRAQNEASDPAKFAAWLPMLQQYGPALVIECENAVKYSEEVVIRWLRDYMFRASDKADAQARLAASQLNKHSLHLTHSRFLNRDFVRKNLGLKVEDLEANQQIQDAVLSVFHLTMMSFEFAARVAKIVESDHGKAYVKVAKD